MIPNGDNEMSAVECAQELHDMLKEKGFDEEVLNNSMQLLKKIQTKSKELSNVEHVDEETPEEDSTETPEDEKEEDIEGEPEGEDAEEAPDYENMSADDMRKDMTKKKIISITIGGH